MLFLKLKAVVVLPIAMSSCHCFTVKCPKFGCPDFDPHNITTPESNTTRFDTCHIELVVLVSERLAKLT